MKRAAGRATSRAAKPRRAARPAGDLARRLAALLRLTVEIGAAPDESAICRSVVAGLHEGLGYEFLGLFLVDPATGDRVLKASVGWPDAPDDYRLPPGRGLSELPLQNGELHYTPRVARQARYVPSPNRGSEVDVPVPVDGRTVGVLVVGLLLAYEHSLVSAGDLSKLNAAFFTMNGVIAVVFFAFVAADLLLRGVH